MAAAFCPEMLFSSVDEMVRKGIPRVCFYFCSTERNSELFTLPRKGSKRNSKCLLLVLFHGTEFREFSVPRNSRNSAGNNHKFRLFRLPRNYLVENSQPKVTKSRELQRDVVYLGWPIAPSYESKCGGREGVGGSQPISTAVHRSPNKLWRSNSTFNLCQAAYASFTVSATA